MKLTDENGNVYEAEPGQVLKPVEPLPSEPNYTQDQGLKFGEKCQVRDKNEDEWREGIYSTYITIAGDHGHIAIAKSKRDSWWRQARAMPTEPKRTIDWSKMPEDTLVEVTDSHDWIKRYFAKAEDNICYTHNDGRTSKNTKFTVPWKKIRLIDNPPRPWFGGSMPCCGNVRVRVWWRNRGVRDGYAVTFPWEHGPGGDDIIAYQMLGEEE